MKFPVPESEFEMVLKREALAIQDRITPRNPIHKDGKITRILSHTFSIHDAFLLKEFGKRLGVLIQDFEEKVSGLRGDRDAVYIRIIYGPTECAVDGDVAQFVAYIGRLPTACTPEEEIETVYS